MWLKLSSTSINKKSLLCIFQVQRHTIINAVVHVAEAFHNMNNNMKAIRTLFEEQTFLIMNNRKWYCYSCVRIICTLVSKQLSVANANHYPFVIFHV